MAFNSNYYLMFLLFSRQPLLRGFGLRGFSLKLRSISNQQILQLRAFTAVYRVECRLVIIPVGGYRDECVWGFREEGDFRLGIRDPQLCEGPLRTKVRKNPLHERQPINLNNHNFSLLCSLLSYFDFLFVIFFFFFFSFFPNSPSFSPSTAPSREKMWMVPESLVHDSQASLCEKVS